jgi:Dihydroorotase
MRFQPLMTLYLTENTPAEEIIRAKDSDSVFAVKYYPAGATTNSQSGVRELTRVYPVLEAMEKHDLPLLLHGEVTDPDIDIFDRERVFIERHLLPLQTRFPALRMVLEHITTRDAVEFVRGAPVNVAATVTAHHLLLNRNALFEGGIRPHNYCAPILKRETHRAALLQAATSGDPHFFPWHGQCTASPRSEGNGLRMRGTLYGPCGAGVVCRSIRSGGQVGSARSVCQLPWPGLLPSAAQPGSHRARTHVMDRTGRISPGQIHLQAHARRRVGCVVGGGYGFCLIGRYGTFRRSATSAGLFVCEMTDQ